MGYVPGQELPELREIDRKAFEFILKMWTETGFTPTSSEIAEEFGIGRGGSTNKVFTALEAHKLILFNEARKSYIPTEWRSIIMNELSDKLGYGSVGEIPSGPEMYEQISATGDLIAEIESLKAELESRPASSSAEMERVRLLQRKRAKKYRDSRKKSKNKKV